MNYKITFTFIIACAGLLGACKSTKKPPAPEPVETLSVAEYQLAGFPDSSRPWRAADFSKALRALERLNQQDATKLPRLHSGVGATAIRQMTDINQYRFMDTGVQSLDARYAALTEVSLAIRGMMLLYYKAPWENSRLRYSPEVVAASIATMWGLEQQVLFAEEITKGSKKLSPMQQSGLQQMKDGMATSINGILLTFQKEYQLYEKADMEKLANYFFPFFNRMQHFLDEDARNKIKATIAQIATTHEDPAIREAAKGL